MRKIIMFIATAIIASQIWAAKVDIKNAYKLGLNCEGYYSLSNALSLGESTFRFGGKYLEDYIEDWKTKEDVRYVMTASRDYIAASYGEGVLKLADTYKRFDVFNQNKDTHWVFRKTVHNVEGMEDKWLVITINNGK